MKATLSVTVKFLVSCLLLLAGLVCAETITGKVIGVMDGDTIEVLDATKTSIVFDLKESTHQKKLSPSVLAPSSTYQIKSLASRSKYCQTRPTNTGVLSAKS